MTRAKTWSSPLIIPTSTCTCRRSETVNELGNHISMLIKNNCAQYLRSYLWLYNQKTKLWIISVTSVEATLIFKICVYSCSCGWKKSSTIAVADNAYKYPMNQSDRGRGWKKRPLFWALLNIGSLPVLLQKPDTIYADLQTQCFQSVPPKHPSF